MTGKPAEIRRDHSEHDAPNESGIKTAESFYSSTGKPEFVKNVFDRIAPRYDFLNSVTSFGMHKRWRRVALDNLRIQPGNHALDIACGTGDFMFGLLDRVGPDGHVTGLDFSQNMLDVARLRLDKVKGNWSLVNGDAENLPFESESIDLITTGFALRNFNDVGACFREMYRVLKPGGRVAALEIARPGWWPYRPLFLFYFEKMLPGLAALFKGEKDAYSWLPASLAAFHSREGIIRLMNEARFDDIQTLNLALGAVCIYQGVKP